VQITLGLVALELTQDLELRERFHAFRHRSQIECEGKPDNARDERGARSIVRQAADERSIDLQNIHRQLR
jgi:hypothetical protein